MSLAATHKSFVRCRSKNSWSLPDLQNKETGELPLLHVYELDPLPQNGGAMLDASIRAGELGRDDDEIKPIKAKNTNDDDDDDDEGSEEDTSRGSDEQMTASSPTKYSFLALAQRRSEVMSRDFLHPLFHRVFGTPLLLRIQGLEGFTGRDLYDTVAVRLRNFVPKSALRFLEVDEDELDLPEPKKHHDDEARRPGYGRQRLKKTTTDMVEVSAGPVPRFGFRLRITSRDWPRPQPLRAGPNSTPAEPILWHM